MKTIPIVQHQDTNLTSKAFDHMEEDTLLVTSTFYTVQGEGHHAGRPAVFLRLAGCNFGGKDISCQFCDSAFEFSKGKVVNFEDLFSQIKNLLPHIYSDKLIVITGGEPTLQKNLVEFVTDYLVEDDWEVQFETNGTHPSFAVALHIRLEEYENEQISFVISPKAVGGKYAVTNNIFGELFEASLKFVVDSNPESPHHTVPVWANDWGNTVFVSPMAVYKKAYEGEVADGWNPELLDHEATSANYRYAAQYCIENGYRLSIQQHIFTSIP